MHSGLSFRSGPRTNNISNSKMYTRWRWFLDITYIANFDSSYRRKQRASVLGNYACVTLYKRTKKFFSFIHADGHFSLFFFLFFFFFFLFFSSPRRCGGVRFLLKATIHYQTLSHDPINCYGNSKNTTRAFIGPLHWFPVATDQIVGLSVKVDLGPVSGYNLTSTCRIR